MRKPTNADVISVAEAAALLGMSERSIARACQRGELIGIKVGRRWLINRTRLYVGLGFESEDKAEATEEEEEKKENEENTEEAAECPCEE